MKVNIKGLVFTGFAAAILSANAMAADNTVTSKSYVDNKFQTLNNMTNTVHASGQTEEGKYPDEAAVRAAIDSASNVANFVSQQVQDGITGKAPSEDAVYDFVGKGSLAIQVNGTQVGNAFGANQATDGTVNITVAAGTADGSIKVNGTDVAVTNAEVTSHKVQTIDTTLQSGKDTNYPSQAAVESYVADTISDLQLDSTYQDLDTGTKYVVSKEGVWEDIGDAVVAGDDNTITITPDGTTGALTVSAVTSDVSNGETALVTGDAVYDYVQGITHGNVIPTMPDSCSSTAPCVLTNDTSTGALVWVPIQQAETQNP